jgi:hypothetical protein
MPLKSRKGFFMILDIPIEIDNNHNMQQNVYTEEQWKVNSLFCILLKITEQLDYLTIPQSFS